MNHSSVEPQLQELLRLTTELHSIVSQQDSEPDCWIDILDQRQKVIEKLTALFAAGSIVTEAHRNTYIEPAYEADQHISRIMKDKKRKAETQLANVRRSKAANEQYGGYENSKSAFGAFFDKRK